MYYMKQWKLPKHRMKYLMKLGVNKDMAKAGAYARNSI